MRQAAYPTPPEQRLERILSPGHSLCREDVVWVLQFVKKKVAEQDPRLLELPQPRLLQNFQHYADAAMMLLQTQPGGGGEAGRLRAALLEATWGLSSPPSRSS